LNRFSLFTRTIGAVALSALIATSLGARAAGPATFSVKPGVDLANLDTTCKACDDFYQFATGGWQKAHPIPAANASWGTFAILGEDNQNVEHTILEDAAKNTSARPGSNEQKIGTYYRMCMNEAAIDAGGLTAIAAPLAEVGKITSFRDQLDETAHLAKIGVGTGLGVGTGADQLDSGKQLAGIRIGGGGLGDRDYYLKDDPRFQKARAAYTTYMTTVFGYLGDDPTKAAAEAAAVLAFETELAKNSPPRETMRDASLRYHPTPVADLKSVAPEIDWQRFFAESGLPPISVVNIGLPAEFKADSALLAATPVDTFKAYDRLRIIEAFTAALPTKFGDASFAFRGTALTGVTEQQPRWKRCVGAVNGALGEALGAVYVTNAFSPAAKTRAKELVDNLQGVLADDIKGLDWMSAPTKTRALEKLNAYTKKIGYPDKFQDYSALQIKDDSYAADLARVRAYERERGLARFNKPTDRTTWGMTPPTVNAYYNSSNNEIVFPAGILHPPFFSDQNDDAVNYGAIGAVIGHEMTHGFDDQGSQFDDKGNRVNWWTPEDSVKFKAKTQCIVDEFNDFEVAPGVHEKGLNVQGEAVADLGGLTIAYKAFEKTPQAKAHKMIDFYTPEQRFFLAYAQVWANNEREAAAVQRATSDPHPDDRFRVLGTLSNMPEFRAAFNCKAGDKMVRANSCQIW
jgi:putative endopeptidase